MNIHPVPVDAVTGSARRRLAGVFQQEKELANPRKKSGLR